MTQRANHPEYSISFNPHNNLTKQARHCTHEKPKLREVRRLSHNQQTAELVLTLSTSSSKVQASDQRQPCDLSESLGPRLRTDLTQSQTGSEAVSYETRGLSRLPFLSFPGVEIVAR